jgi:hypothetical protein
MSIKRRFQSWSFMSDLGDVLITADVCVHAALGTLEAVTFITGMYID